MKFKVGDYVKVVKDEKTGYLGSVGYVVDINPELLYEYTVLVNDKERCFKESELEGVSKASIGDSIPCPTKPVETVQQGIKFDSEKEEYSLLPKRVLKPVMRVLSFGAKKYAKDNWQKVPNAKERYFNALHRHLDAWWCGEKYDKETGENHLAHAACCLLFLLWFEEREVEVKDDR